MVSTLFDDLCSWAGSFGITVSRTQLEKLELFIAELWSWQKKMNLTGLNTKERVVRELLLDSLFPLPYVPETGNLLDLGSGAGFPAIPLKICLPDVYFYLIEPRTRKAAFLKEIIRLLELGRIGVIPARIEESGGVLNSRGYEVITARAVAPLRHVLEWCGPYLGRNGVLINFQGGTWKMALKECNDAIKRQRLVLSRKLPYRLPGKAGERIILFFSREERA